MNRKTLILAVILVILIAVAFIYQELYRQWQQSRRQGEDFFSGVNIDNLTKIEIEEKDATGTTVLMRDDRGWKLDGSEEFYIKDNAESELERSLQMARNGELEIVSDNKNRKEEFETGENGVLVTLYEGDNVMEFVVGGYGIGYKGSYISRPGIKETYLTDADLTSVFNRKEWVDPVIFAADKEKIDELRFQYPDSEFTVKKQGDEWKGVQPYQFQASHDKIDKIVETMANLTAAEIPEQTFEGTGLTDYSIIVEASGKDINNTIMVGGKNTQGLYYAKKVKSDNIYLIVEKDRNTLKRSIADLR